MTENEIGTIVVEEAIAVHRELGPGLLETVYEIVLARELQNRGLSVDRMQPWLSSERWRGITEIRDHPLCLWSTRTKSLRLCASAGENKLATECKFEHTSRRGAEAQRLLTAGKAVFCARTCFFRGGLWRRGVCRRD